MPRAFRLRLTNTETLEASEVTAEFDDHEWAQVQRFQEFALELNDCALVKSGLMNNYTIEFGVGDTMTVSSQPDRSAVAELAMYLRPFVLQNERTYFTVITGILGRRLEHPRVRSLLGSWNDEFANKHSRQLYELSINSVPLNTEHTLQTWLNGVVYHRFEAKRRTIESLQETMPEPVMNAIMLDLLAVKAACVLHLAALVRALDNRMTVQIGSLPTPGASGVAE